MPSIKPNLAYKYKCATCGLLWITDACADVLEVNGLAVDWISSHIYWTDGRKRSVEVAGFNGTNRRILITERLSQPRGIYADPQNGFVFDSRLKWHSHSTSTYVKAKNFDVRDYVDVRYVNGP